MKSPWIPAAIVLVGVVLLVAAVRGDRDLVLHGAPAGASCSRLRDYSYLCVSDQTLYTCVLSSDTGFSHLVLDCAPVKGCRQ